MPYTVITRVRPCINAEVGKRTTIQLPSAKPKRLRLVRDDERMSYLEWEFDHVLGVEARQEDAYAKVRPILHGVESNVTILAYGQTGSGKTYTMFGGRDRDKGIVPRALDDIFTNVDSRCVPHAKVMLSFMELYKDEVHDLLSPHREEKLDIRELGSGNITVPGMTLVEVATVDQALQILSIGLSHRHCGDNGINADSSRSHAIFAIDLQGELGTRRINFVDLAGSEKIATKPLNYIKQSLFPEKNSRSRCLAELTSINKSLSALGQCIGAMVDKSRTHIPYRDSKLTRLLKESLSGSSFCAMIVCVSPAISCFDETFCTLKFADRAKKAIVPADPETQREPLSAARLYQLEAQISHLSSELAFEREERKRLQRHLNEALRSPTSFSEDSFTTINNVSNISDLPRRDASSSTSPAHRRLSQCVLSAHTLSQSTLSMSTDQGASQVNLSADRLELVRNFAFAPDSQYAKQSIHAGGTNVVDNDPSTTRCSQNSEQSASDDTEESFASSEVVRDDNVEELLQVSHEVVGAQLALKLEMASQMSNVGFDGRSPRTARHRVDKDEREANPDAIASLSSLEKLVAKQTEFHQLIKRYIDQARSSPLSRNRHHKQRHTSRRDGVFARHQKLNKRSSSRRSKNSSMDERYSAGDLAECDIVSPKDFSSLVRMVKRIDRNVRSSMMLKCDADAAEDSIGYGDSLTETTGATDTADEGHGFGVTNQYDNDASPMSHAFNMMPEEKNYHPDATLALIRRTQRQ